MEQPALPQFVGAQCSSISSVPKGLSLAFGAKKLCGRKLKSGSQKQGCSSGQVTRCLRAGSAGPTVAGTPHMPNTRQAQEQTRVPPAPLVAGMCPAQAEAKAERPPSRYWGGWAWVAEVCCRLLGPGPQAAHLHHAGPRSSEEPATQQVPSKLSPF